MARPNFMHDSLSICKEQPNGPAFLQPFRGEVRVSLSNSESGHDRYSALRNQRSKTKSDPKRQTDVLYNFQSFCSNIDLKAYVKTC